LSFPIATALCVQTYFILVILRFQVGIFYLSYSLLTDFFTRRVLLVHFWAPTFKWGISIANIADFAKPPEKISYPQQIGISHVSHSFSLIMNPEKYVNKHIYIGCGGREGTIPDVSFS